jgi:DNA uptake protein ComE-like DNA-binding protein
MAAACADADTDAEAGGALDQPAAGDTAAGPSALDETGPLVNPNEATEEELEALPGMDSATIATVVAGRPYADMLALHRELSASMDSTALESLYRRMFIPIDLNAATTEEILLIPGVGDRMAHEFEEYRPYRAIAEFRREIGKYVDEQEVARLERYVRLD